MFDSESDDDHFIPAVLNRPTVANHIIHEAFTVDTRDHEDHTFCGVMFDVCCRGEGEEGSVPIEFLQIDSVSVRGDLGPLTVWTTPNSFRSKEHMEIAWRLVYEREHAPSRQTYATLEFSEPIRLAPGESCGLYVHSKLPGDDALVYDNQRSTVTYEDRVLRVLPGLAHLSNRPFGRQGMWGFPWRENREFVGRVSYGVGYTLWNPDAEVHRRFPLDFRRALRTCLLCAQRPESPLHYVQNEVIYYIFNMCRYDWFSTSPPQFPRSGGQTRGAVGAGSLRWWRPGRHVDLLSSTRRWLDNPMDSDSDSDMPLAVDALAATSSGQGRSTASGSAARPGGEGDTVGLLSDSGDEESDEGGYDTDDVEVDAHATHQWEVAFGGATHDGPSFESENDDHDDDNGSSSDDF